MSNVYVSEVRVFGLEDILNEYIDELCDRLDGKVPDDIRQQLRERNDLLPCLGFALSIKTEGSPTDVAKELSANWQFLTFYWRYVSLDAGVVGQKVFCRGEEIEDEGKVRPDGAIRVSPKDICETLDRHLDKEGVAARMRALADSIDRDVLPDSRWKEVRERIREKLNY